MGISQRSGRDGHPAAAGVPNIVETITYDDNARVETVSDGRRRRRLSYDELGQVTSVTDEALDGSATTRTTCHLSGPGRGLLETVTPEGNRVRLVHDGEGRIIRVIAGRWGASPLPWDDSCPAGDSPTVEEQSSGLYLDGLGRPLTITDERGVVAGANYDASGRPVIEDLGGRGSSTGLRSAWKRGLESDLRPVRRRWQQLGQVHTRGRCSARTGWTRPWSTTTTSAAAWSVSGGIDTPTLRRDCPWATSMASSPADPENRGRQAGDRARRRHTVDHHPRAGPVSVITSLDPAADDTMISSDAAMEVGPSCGLQ